MHKPDVTSLADQLNAATKKGDYFKAMHLARSLDEETAGRVAQAAGYELPKTKWQLEFTANFIKKIGKAIELRTDGHGVTKHEQQRGGLER